MIRNAKILKFKIGNYELYGDVLMKFKDKEGAKKQYLKSFGNKNDFKLFLKIGDIDYSNRLYIDTLVNYYQGLSLRNDSKTLLNKIIKTQNKLDIERDEAEIVNFAVSLRTTENKKEKILELISGNR